jgi:hypothetical protein
MHTHVPTQAHIATYTNTWIHKGHAPQPVAGGRMLEKDGILYLIGYIYIYILYK